MTKISLGNFVIKNGGIKIINNGEVFRCKK